VSDHTTSIFRKVKVKRKKRSISDKERAVVDAALKENRCRCALFDCKHLIALWDASEALDAAIRASRASRKEK
jgi:hypothetical protein